MEKKRFRDSKDSSEQVPINEVVLPCCSDLKVGLGVLCWSVK